MTSKVFKHIRQKTFIPALLNKTGLRRNIKDTQGKIDLAVIKNSESVAIKETAAAIKRYFNRTNIKLKGLPSDFINEIAYHYVMRKFYNIETFNSHNEVLQKIKALPVELLSCDKWKDLCYISIYNGLFQVGFVARGKAVEQAYNKAKHDRVNLNDLINAFKGALDQGDYKLAGKFLSKIEEKSIEKVQFDGLKLFYQLMKGEKNNASKQMEQSYTEQDYLFANYLRGKSVAIVGPAPTKEDLASEIDLFGVVIRLNYRGNEYLPNPKQFGAKLNVSYYNGERAAAISKGKSYTFFENIDYAVFKSIKFDFQESLINEGKGRKNFSANDYNFIGTSNMIQNVLADLQFFNPSKIKLFKINLFLSKVMHHEGYQLNNLDNGPLRFWKNLAVHDPITQFNFTKNLWKSGQIEVDKSCEDVLRFSPEEYMQKLEKIYVKEPLKILYENAK